MRTSYTAKLLMALKSGRVTLQSTATTAIIPAQHILSFSMIL